MKQLCRIIAVIIAFSFVMPFSAFAKDNVSVDETGSLVKNGAKYSGLYNDVYYNGGTREIKLNGVKRINGTDYCFRQGRSYTGVYGNRYYKNGVWCSILNGKHKLDGKKYQFENGVIVDDTNVNGDGSGFTERVNLFSGPMSGFYYENGHVDFNYTGYKTYLNNTYYVKDGKLFNGYYEKCFYKNGLADKDYNGMHKIDGKDYCFVAGYIFTGIYKNTYYFNGIKKEISGYKKIDNIRYFLDKGVLANGVFDGAMFKNGLVDVKANGRIKVGEEYYTFINGITSDGLHDGKWYTGGEFDKTANGVKIYNGLPHYLKDGKVSTGVCNYKDKNRYFEKGSLKAYTGWKDIDENRYYILDGIASSGVAEIDNVKYLFDNEGKLCKGTEAVFENVVYTSDENGVAALAPQIYIPQRGNPLPYPHKKRPNATIATSGCGVCSSLMIIENSTTYRISIEEFTQKCLDNGCRTPTGSDMDSCGRLLQKEYGFEFERTNDIEKLKEHLKKGYLAVACVGKIPLFSFTGGHFMVIAGLLDEDNAVILEPNSREGKYGVGTRSDIHFNKANNEVYASFETIKKDAQCGCYWLFTPTQNVAIRHSSTTNEMIEQWKKDGTIE